MSSLSTFYHLAKFANNHPLASKSRGQTFIRFVRWQVASRAIRQPVVVPFVGDTRLIISKTMPGAAGNFYYGLQEVVEVALALHFLRSGELLGDIGANIGGLSVAVAGVAKARAVAMEPVPASYQAMRDNIALNGLNDLVQTYPEGAGDAEAVLNFSTGQGTNDRVATSSGGAGASLRIRPLDQVFTETPDMLVLDVEGYEPAVIKGASRLLADPQLKIIIAETLGLSADYGLDDKAMHQTILQHGFGTYQYDPFKRRLRPTEGMDPVNTIYVRDLEYVEKRLKEAPSFQVDGAVI